MLKPIDLHVFRTTCTVHTSFHTQAKHRAGNHEGPIMASRDLFRKFEAFRTEHHKKMHSAVGAGGLTPTTADPAIEMSNMDLEVS